LQLASLKDLGIDSFDALAPSPDGLAADYGALRRQDQFRFSNTQAEAMKPPNGLVDDSSGKRKQRYSLGVVLMPETLPLAPTYAYLTVPSLHRTIRRSKFPAQFAKSPRSVEMLRAFWNPWEDPVKLAQPRDAGLLTDAAMLNASLLRP
jgi:hypothetical protein